LIFFVTIIVWVLSIATTISIDFCLTGLVF